MTRQWTACREEYPEDDRRIIFICPDGFETEGVYRECIFIAADGSGSYFTPEYWRYL